MYFVHPQIKLSSAFRAVLSLIKPVSLDKLIKKLSFYFPEKQLIFTDMGRTAFRVIIEKMNLQNSEMLLPAYICDIFYPILKNYGIRPIFLDVDLKTFHIKIEDIRNKITPNTKSILVCHTYGLPIDMGAVREAVGERVFIIEDCAHAFFAAKDGAFAGNFGDVSFFSLYKQFPALRGGMLVCPKKWRIELPETKFNFRDLLSLMNYFWPFAFFFKKFGSEYAKTHLREEKLFKPGGIIKASLKLFADFFNDAEESSERRKKIALLFQQELKNLGFEVQEPADNVFYCLSALVPDNLADKRDKIVQELKKYRIFCTRIWNERHVIILNKAAQEDYQINSADFPNTLSAAKRIINFPLQNHYQEKDIKKIINSLRRAIPQL